MHLALLKAIAEKLIPGIPEDTRIAILQQTKLTDEESGEKPETADNGEASVLEQVIEKATAKHAIEQDIKSISSAILTLSHSNTHIQTSNKA
jgi:hypothetical protein